MSLPNRRIGIESGLLLCLLTTRLCMGATSAWLGTAPSGAAYPPGEADRQYEMLLRDLRQRPHFQHIAKETYRPESLIQEADRDPLDVILRRTASLLADLQHKPNAPDLAETARSLESLTAAASQVAIDHTEERRALFDRACHLRRQIAFANPLVAFDQLLFIKRHRAICDHCCDQYYGITQRPGGGLFVLADPFGAHPTVRDLLASSAPLNARLKGQPLTGGPKRDWSISYDGMGNLNGDATEGGSFLSPSLSYDGKTVVFAYVECQGDRHEAIHTDPSRGHWAEGRSYHLFRMNLDGSDLRQLSDGTWNDFDPCFMPSGRIAFISERRGGYLRCGRACPTFTVYDMADDGSDIRCLSFHETNEWNPGVSNDGMLVWTRWDYVDRHGTTAHHPWLMTPDGRNPRAMHGNFSLRPSRADMELCVRAIPGSSRFVAVAAPHHGQAFGSLILIDPASVDDDAMSPVRRVTPEIGFPETQGGTESLGTPWPLSEDYHLCAFEPLPGAKGLYGLYLVDSFGNRELIYRDPDISCLSPIPVRARPCPPVIQELARPANSDGTNEATIAIANVYDSQRAWPEGTKITALRVYQVLPMSVPSGYPPHETGLRIPQSLDSVNIARAILGMVPVEQDGSAHFTVPAQRELYFQALSQDGLAITSMRSATQLQPGEHLSCQGCHEPRSQAPRARASEPLALRRPPSRLLADADGTNPFSYPRLVQPVLEANCVPCHAKSPDKAPRLDAAPVRHGNSTFFASYLSLTPKFGFFNYGGGGWNDAKWYRTTPGAFGAQASPLYAMLKKGHHDVKLPPADLHRLTVWLDSCSLFYGVYEKEGGEAQLRGEVAHPTLQ
ncbi:MAG: hypothetical protein NT154_08680 [Verrucomicrobia bacterium]|nr:hypothetical protein [Verrucomicrobiota bacterium]